MSTSQNKKQLKILVSDEQKLQLEAKAKAEGKSMTAYILDNLLDDDYSSDNERKNEEGIYYFKVNMTEEERTKLNSDAKSFGLTTAAYIRNLIRKRSDVTIKVEIQDIKELIDIIYSLTIKINGIIAVMLKTNKAYDKDVEVLTRLFLEMNETINKYYKTLMADRRRLYNEEKKKAYEIIEKNNFRHRRDRK